MRQQHVSILKRRKSMTIKCYPGGDRNYVEFIRSFRPEGSQTVFWPVDMETKQNLLMLKWGNKIYLPVYVGMHFGLAVHNGSGRWMGYPIFVGGANLWEGGPTDIRLVTPRHMWELMPGQTDNFDKVVKPFDKSGRPLIVTVTGVGNTISEAQYGTGELSGDICVYEKRQYGAMRAQSRGMNEGTGMRGMTAKGVTPASRGAEPESLGFDETVYGAGERTGKAGIGLGAEEFQDHHTTGVQYQADAQPVIFMQTEFREDLNSMLRNAWPWWTGEYWWNGMTNDGWWDTPWSWGQPTMPTVPVIKPHRPNWR